MPARCNERLIVILNDNDMSIAPPVGAMSAYLARLGLRPHLSDAARRSASSSPGICPSRSDRAIRRRGRGIRARLRHRRHAVRGTRLLLCRPDRRAQSRSPAAGAAERARRRDGPILVHVVTQKGKGYAPAEASRRQVSRRRQVRRRHRRAGQGRRRNAPSYTKVFGESLVKEARKDDQHRRDHRGDAVGHRARHVREGVPQARLRRRHCRAARGDLRRRAWRPRA